MRRLSHLWRSLETVPGLQAIPAFWELYCGTDIDLIRPHLRLTDTTGTLYPCPRPRSGHCPRKIVDYGDGQFAAICRDPHEICERVPLTPRDVLLQELDIASFAKSLAGPLGIRCQQPTVRAAGVWSIGLSSRRDAPSWPVFLLLAQEAARFLSAVQDLLLSVPGPFVILAPTDRHRTVAVHELLQARGILFLPFDDHLHLDDAGRLAATAPELPGTLHPTPVADRRRVVKEFVARTHCKVKDIQEPAGVDEADYYKWLGGKTPDHYSTCVAIERVLRHGPAVRQGNAAVEAKRQQMRR